MSIRYNIHEAKTRLSRLLDQVEKGEDVVIFRSGKPVVHLKAYVSATGRKGGECKGLVRTGKDFDEPLPRDIEQAFRGDAE